MYGGITQVSLLAWVEIPALVGFGQRIRREHPGRRVEMTLAVLSGLELLE